MTRSKIQKIKFFVFFLIYLLPQIASCDGIFRDEKQNVEKISLVKKNLKSDLKESIDNVPLISNVELKETHAQNLKNVGHFNISEKASVNITSKSAAQGSTTTISPKTTTPSLNGVHIPSINSGALMRGIFVIIGLSVIVMAYMVFRSFRLSKTRAQMVRKYGVLAHRQDVEMRPLPLDEDDDDDTTVFDASNIPSHRLQSQDT